MLMFHFPWAVSLFKIRHFPFPWMLVLILFCLASTQSFTKP